MNVINLWTNYVFIANNISIKQSIQGLNYHRPVNNVIVCLISIKIRFIFDLKFVVQQIAGLCQILIKTNVNR